MITEWIASTTGCQPVSWAGVNRTSGQAVGPSYPKNERSPEGTRIIDRHGPDNRIFRLASPTDYVVLVDGPREPNQAVTQDEILRYIRNFLTQDVILRYYATLFDRCATLRHRRSNFQN